MTYGLAEQDTVIELQLDEDDRVVGVTITSLTDEARDPEALNAAFQTAYQAALAGRRPAATDILDAHGRVRAARVELPSRRPMRELVEEALRYQDPQRERPHVRLIGGERGLSGNECVSVVLDRTGPGGQLEFDAGWLRQAETRNVAAGIQQAFAAAYTERSKR